MSVSTGIVNFFGWELTAIIDSSGMVWLDPSEICMKIGLDPNRQLDSMIGQTDVPLVQLSDEGEPQFHPIVTPGGAGAWLALLDWRKIADPETQSKVMLLQVRLGEILNQAFIGHVAAATLVR
jgi:hypothetical protein